ncbi:DUF2213 domain-containing protein [Komagataeibacter nataicola]|uniref:DUF2213 domain-containing protein n=1 Tax=Komagataeibacter nataicola TaxID=265960 RepID=UPI000995FFE6
MLSPGPSSRLRSGSLFSVLLTTQRSPHNLSGIETSHGKLHSPLHGRRLPLAYDRSVRRVDKDGHLFVDKCTLSSAIVSQYYGWEIPDGESLGFTRDRLYRLYRDADALRTAAPSLNGKPILMDHTAITAQTHPIRRLWVRSGPMCVLRILIWPVP